MIKLSKPIASTKISLKGQISIPKDVRELLGAETGDLILFFKNEKGDIVIKAKV